MTNVQGNNCKGFGGWYVFQSEMRLRVLSVKCMKRLQSVTKTHKNWCDLVRSSSFAVPMTNPSSPLCSLLSPLSFTLSHLAQNPFMCDCHLKWLADYLFDNPIETSGARCSHPRRLANKRISQVKGKKFRCTGRRQVHSHTHTPTTTTNKQAGSHRRNIIDTCSFTNT